jgi:signal transduction histidine kinase
MAEVASDPWFPAEFFDFSTARTSGRALPVASPQRAAGRDVWRTDAFVATLAHELRQPLSAMTAAVEVVRLAPGTEEAHRATDLMRRQLREMSRLVEDLVDAKRLSCGKVTLRRSRVDVGDLMREAVADVGGLVAERRQTLAVSGDGEHLWVNGDAQRLRQVLLNLVRNAANYTPCGGSLWVAVAGTASLITLRVGDTGRGIEAQALAHVFDLFSQANPQEGTGLGIGLNIAREIVLLHGGSIEAHSRGAGTGCEFIVQLPVAAVGDLTYGAAMG